jgi:peptidyl-prolyl cis-trans isomerase B (cyclophilin B)
MSTQVKLTTSSGDVVIELEDEKAPATVENFLAYVDSGFYDGTVFHRVIDGFMIQGGGFEPGMKQKPTRDPISNEANNGLKNEAYTIAMARTTDVDSATAQFFINVAKNDFLNFSAPTPEGFGYCVFGQVVEGRDVVDQIKGAKTGSKGYHSDVPVEDVVIKSAQRI